MTIQSNMLTSSLPVIRMQMPHSLPLPRFVSWPQPPPLSPNNTEGKNGFHCITDFKLWMSFHRWILVNKMGSWVVGKGSLTPKFAQTSKQKPGTQHHKNTTHQTSTPETNSHKNFITVEYTTYIDNVHGGNLDTSV